MIISRSLTRIHWAQSISITYLTLSITASRCKGQDSIFIRDWDIIFLYSSVMPSQVMMATSSWVLLLYFYPVYYRIIILFYLGHSSKEIPAGRFSVVVLLMQGVMQIIIVPLRVQGCGVYLQIIICRYSYPIGVLEIFCTSSVSGLIFFMISRDCFQTIKNLLLICAARVRSCL